MSNRANHPSVANGQDLAALAWHANGNEEIKTKYIPLGHGHLTRTNYQLVLCHRASNLSLCFSGTTDVNISFSNGC